MRALHLSIFEKSDSECDIVYPEQSWDL